MMRNSYIFICFVLLLSVGCGGPQDASTKKSAEYAQDSETAPVISSTESNPSVEQELKPGEFKPFYVYKDKGFANRFAPSGYMPNGECLYVNDAWTENCSQGNSCIKVIYDIDCSKKGRNWAGIYWLNPADNWGDRKGAYNLSGAQKLTFMARGEKGGERIEEFKIGGVGRGMDYPDSDNAFIGPVILTNEWKEYTIDLRGKDLTSISGGFAWISDTDANSQACVFYLDDIQYK